MSSSDQDMSDTSNLESPYSQRMESPYSSPSQQVPQLANFMNVLTCGENYHRAGNSGPYLRIVEQPVDHFRFRYRSEMIGTHGCLAGKSSANSKIKTHPTVELMNYTGKALIRCRLAQNNSDEEHPHKLLEDDQDRDVSAEVPEGGSYKVGFGGMGIIHTAKKDVPALLFQKFVAQGQHINEKELRMRCEFIAKKINLNIVRLRFSAHDLKTDEEICPPVFSEPIHNMKSAATNDLRICRASRCFGGPLGGDDVFIFVEKVNKKNIKIRFYELDSNGDEVWSANGIFLQSDVHHQYAIVFRTPKYKETQIERDVNVWYELVRPSDGRSSEPRAFTYKADPVYRQNKKRKANSAYSSIGSSGGSLNSLDLPAPVQAANNENVNFNPHVDVLQAEKMIDIKEFPSNIPKVPTPVQVSTADNLMAQALMHEMSGTVTLFPNICAQIPTQPAPVEPEAANSSIGPPVLQLDSTEMDNIVNGSMSPDERKRFDEMFVDYAKSINDSFPLIGMSMLMTDSGRAKQNNDTSPPKRTHVKMEPSMDDEFQENKNEYSGFYNAEDGKEVRKLVKELCEIIGNKTGYKKHVVRAKLERLFEMRLSNGDTFLHMTLCSNQPSTLEYIVNLIHSVNMTHLLNLRNNDRRTILHQAIKLGLSKIIPFLVSKGCDPMAEDDEGNNAVHYAVKYQSCLEPLLDAIRDNNVHYDINAYNNEKQTALHLASRQWWAGGVAALARRGAARGARDGLARTPLHLAAYDAAAPAASALLAHMHPDEIDAVDGQGHTALQIVCGGQENSNSIEILKLLLEKKADPLKHEDFNKPAWKLCSDKPEMWEIMQKYVSNKIIIETEPEIKSEPEDDYESADDTEWSPASLFELSLYGARVSRLLDLSGAWRALAAALRRADLAPVLAAARSPTRTLLEHLQTCHDITSETLAQALDSIGQAEAATIVRSCIVKKT